MASVTAGPAAAILDSAPGAFRLAVEGGDAAEHPERDLEIPILLRCGEGMTELVKEDRGEEAEGAGDREGERGGRGGARFAEGVAVTPRQARRSGTRRRNQHQSTPIGIPRTQNSVIDPPPSISAW